ncbi:MAG: cytosine permease, partial [Thermoguttaceae bacterium]
MSDKKSTQLPDYVASATPNPFSNRVFWLTSTASTYAGVMLWFVFWQSVPDGAKPNLGGLLVAGLPLALGALVLAAFLCHFCCYIAPGMLGMKSGLPLSIVGTSTYGVQGGFFMPGFLMGALQFGWLSVNAFFAGLLLASIAGYGAGSVVHFAISILWILLAVFMGFNGIKYVGMVSSFTPIIPIGVLLFWFSQTAGGLGSFNPTQLIAGAEEGAKPVSLYGNQALGVLSVMCAYIVGFFATAGAAGCDFGSNNKDAKAVQLGGLVGIVLATVFTGAFALLIVAGAQGLSPDSAVSSMNVTALMEKISPNSAKVCMLLLALAAFPSACFPSLI